MNTIDYTKLGVIGAEAAYQAAKTAGKKSAWLMAVHDGLEGTQIGFAAFRGDEPARTAYAEAVVRAYLEQVGEGFPIVGDCLQAMSTSPTTGQAIEAIRRLMLAAFAKKMEAVAKLPDDALSLPAVEVEHDPYAELKAARAEGKIIQWMTSTGWANHIYPDEECPLWMHPAKDYRIAPDQPEKPGKLTDEELGKIGLQAANHTNHQTNFYQAFASAVRKEVEAAQAEEITRLTEDEFVAACSGTSEECAAWNPFEFHPGAVVECPDDDVIGYTDDAVIETDDEYGGGDGVPRPPTAPGHQVAWFQKTYEVERNCSAERMAKIHAHEEEIRRLTARTVGQLSEITILHQLLDVEETKLARLLPRPISIAPTKDDIDVYGKVLILGHERMACSVDINDWQIANGWTHWLPCSLGAYGITPPPPAPTAEDVERERFEKAYRIESLREQPEGAVFDNGVLARAENGDYLHWATRSTFRMWQAACAVKEGKGER